MMMILEKTQHLPSVTAVSELIQIRASHDVHTRLAAEHDPDSLIISTQLGLCTAAIAH